MRFPLMLLLAALVANSAASADQPTPGLYRVTTAVQGPGMPAGTVTASAESCVTAADITEDPASLLGELPGADGCTVTESTWRDGKLGMAMRCSMEGIDMRADSRGTYRADGWTITTTMRMSMGGSTMEMVNTVTGERVGDC